jgi:hypothetical protein
MTNSRITGESVTIKRLERAGWLLALTDIRDKILGAEAGTSDLAEVRATVEALLAWDYGAA